MKYLLVPLFLVSAIFFSCNSSEVPDDEAFSSLGITPVGNDFQTPSISFLDGQGEQLYLDDFRGSVVMLNFWATWCPPCRSEMPAMSELYGELEGSDFEMAAVNVGETEELVKAFIREFDIDFPVYFDPLGNAADSFGISAIPTTLILDRRGKVRAYVSGAFEWNSEEVISMLRDWSS